MLARESKNVTDVPRWQEVLGANDRRRSMSRRRLDRDEWVERLRRTASYHPAIFTGTDVAQVLPREDAAVAVFPVHTDGVATDVFEAFDLESGRGAKHVERALLRLFGLFVPVHPGFPAGRARAKVSQHVDGKFGGVPVFPANIEPAAFGQGDTERMSRRQQLYPPYVARSC